MLASFKSEKQIHIHVYKINKINSNEAEVDRLKEFKEH